MQTLLGRKKTTAKNMNDKTLIAFGEGNPPNRFGDSAQIPTKFFKKRRKMK